MHFIGMLAFIMPMPMSYDNELTAFSMLAAILASGFALFLLKSPVVRFRSLRLLCGIIMGDCTAAMHYIGMAAMNMRIFGIYPVFFSFHFNFYCGI